MITLSPFLKARGKDGAFFGSKAGEKLAEALNRIVSVLLQGIARNGFNYDTAATRHFEESVRGLRSEFESAADEATALLVAGGAIRLMEEHHAAGERHLAARQGELEAVVALLSDTLLQVARAGPDVMARVKEIERDFSLSTRIEGLAAARARLAACLWDLRAEALAEQPAQGSTPVRAGDGETDSVTGLPDAGHATAALRRVWSRRTDYYAAVFSLERLDTINMRFGFQAGDQMLMLLGRHIAQQLTPGDQLFRWRGPYLLMLLERRLPETLVASEMARIAPVRLESALAVRDREVMVPISAAWSLFPLSEQSGIDQLARKLSECAASHSRTGRKVSAAAAR